MILDINGKVVMLKLYYPVVKLQRRNTKDIGKIYCCVTNLNGIKQGKLKTLFFKAA